MARPIVIDLFSGAGGMSLGFEQAGFDVAVAIEIDPVDADVYKFNFPDIGDTLPRYLGHFRCRRFDRLQNIGRRKVDVVVGGAPCQGFSLTGDRALEDPRNELVREFLRIGLHPVPQTPS